MYKNVNTKIKKILQLLDEIESYELYKHLLIRKCDKLFADYQSGKYDYSAYKDKLKQVLKTRTKKDWINYYDSYVYSLLKQMEMFNADIYSDLTGVEKPKQVEKALAKPVKIKTPEKSVRELVESKIPEPKLLAEDVPSSVKFKSPFAWFLSLFSKKAPKPKIKVESKKTVKVKGSGLKDLFRKPMTLEEDKPQKRIKLKDSTAIEHSGFLSFRFLKRLFSKPDSGVFAKNKNEVNITTLNLAKAKERIKYKAGVDLDTTLLAREVKHIKGLMSKKPSYEIYNLSFFSYLSNLVVRQLTYFLLKQFPGFFKGIYNDLRLANIKLLSNTYVNLMVFSSLVGFVIAFILSAISLGFTSRPLGLVFVQSLFYSLIFGVVVFALFFLYPKIQISSRKRSIHTNLPFAINHMAAVAGSGVSPAKMFELISESKEYGDFSIEIAKIVQYTQVFGYDLLTAIKTALSISPSPRLKEFFEGFVSTVESGGDLKDYLQQRSKEAMISYELERKRYQETVSTYSDIYTGIMVAAPLFFVAALSLVSMLGGSLGGMDVNVVIVLGTYVIIPLMNLIFLAFLNITQIEV
jgi:pilus assembly protein TadC